jgi:amino acid efflux transporter
MGAHRLGLGMGTAMFVGAVLGPGVMVLPSLGIAAAGPASILAWVLLLALSVPVAVCFAALGARHPHGGGISSFVARAFGERAAASVGWWFYTAVPVGVLSAALVGGHYVTVALDLGENSHYAVGGVLLALAFGANYVGLQLSGRVQLTIVGALVALLLVTVIVALPHASMARFTPFFPEDPLLRIGDAAVVLFFAFSGWEAASHLSAEFANPRRHLPRVTWLTLLIVTTLYLSLVVTTVGVLGAEAGNSSVPMMHLLEAGLGDVARPIAALVAVLLSLGAMNTYVAGVARLGGALGHSGALPFWFAKGGGVGEVPRRSLTIQAVATFALLGVAFVWSLDLDILMTLTSVLLMAVTLAGTLAAARLLTRPALRASAVIGVVCTLAVLPFGGLMLVFPLVLALAGAAFWRPPAKSGTTEESGVARLREELKPSADETLSHMADPINNANGEHLHPMAARTDVDGGSEVSDDGKSDFKLR